MRGPAEPRLEEPYIALQQPSQTRCGRLQNLPPKCPAQDIPRDRFTLLRRARPTGDVGASADLPMASGVPVAADYHSSHGLAGVVGLSYGLRSRKTEDRKSVV